MNEVSRKSDLGVRTLSAIVMLAVAGGALWLGEWFWTVFVLIVAAGVYFEWVKLVSRFSVGGIGRIGWFAGGILYIGATPLDFVIARESGVFLILLVVGAVICTDVGAYLFGRAIGGPKIAPSISPSKTWAGLAGGIVGSTVSIAVTFLLAERLGRFDPAWQTIGLTSVFTEGPLIACVAQAGDFFESWMKRRAGVKDSGALLPGHGGLFDRVDGLIAVIFVYFVYEVGSIVLSLLAGNPIIPPQS